MPFAFIDTEPVMVLRRKRDLQSPRSSEGGWDKIPREQLGPVWIHSETLGVSNLTQSLFFQDK